ncbi:MAG: hypothetical protein OXC44_06000 [Proteobacteria bacterium]|nr:hypothetical protein [Pseudomonadota bacterium]
MLHTLILNHLASSLRRYVFRGKAAVAHKAVAHKATMKAATKQKTHRYLMVALTCGVLLSVGACFKDKDKAQMGFHDFVSSPVSYRMIESYRPEGEMLATQKTYEFETCLKDRISMRSLPLSLFKVGGESYVSDEEGCLKWKQTESFNPYVQSHALSKTFEIVGEGKYPGRLVIAYKLNPWAGLRPTTSAEFVEVVGDDDPHNPNNKSVATEQNNAATDQKTHPSDGADGVNKPALLKISRVERRVFAHNTAARDHETHWHLDIDPQLEVFDDAGVSHSLIPENGTLDVVVELMSLNKDYSLTKQNLSHAKTLKVHTFKKQSIKAGKLHVIEKLSSAITSERDNLLLKISLKSHSEFAGDGLKPVKTLYFVNQDLDRETLQEADLAEVPAVAGAGEGPPLQKEGFAHATFFAQNPKIAFLKESSRTTTTVTYDLQFSVKLIHRSSRKPIKNTDLLVSLQGHDESRQVRVNSDGVIHFDFPFLYDIYTMQSKLQDLRFVITNTEKTLSVEVPLFFRPWGDGTVWSSGKVLSENPDKLSSDVLAKYRALKAKKPTVFIHKYDLKPPKDFRYLPRKDLSLRIHYDYQFSASVKMRSKIMKEFGQKSMVVDAPDGLYRLDAYLTCAKQKDRHLINRSLYHLSIGDDLRQITVQHIMKNKGDSSKPRKYLRFPPYEQRTVEQKAGEAYNYTFCPASMTSQDVYVKDGNIPPTVLPITLPDARMSWLTTQLTFVLTPYETKELAVPIHLTPPVKLAKNVDVAPMTNRVTIKRFNKSSRSTEGVDLAHRDGESVSGNDQKDASSGRVSLSEEDMSYDGKPLLGDSEYHSWEEVQLLVKKWNILERYYAHFNTLDSEYLESSNLKYVSLEEKPYSALHFPKQKTQKGSVPLKRHCLVEGGECLDDVSKYRSMSVAQLNKKVFSEVGLSLTAEELREIAWNREGSRQEELVHQICGLWFKDIPHLRTMLRENYLFYERSHFFQVGSPEWYGLVKHYFEPYFEKCRQIRSGEMHHSLREWLSQTVVVHHLLKGSKVEARAKDAGTDILAFKDVRSKAITRGLALYQTMSASFNAVEFLESLSKAVVSFGVGLKTSFSKSGEYEESDQEELGGGATHYSNWTTLQVYLKFDRPKHCFLLRLNYENFYKNFFGGFHESEFKKIMDTQVAREWLENLFRGMGDGYLICTDKQPPELLKAKESDPQTSVAVVEHYRYPAPRFEDTTIYDSSLERFRSWLYPLRGQSDYLKFIYSLTDLDVDDPEGRNEVNTIPEFPGLAGLKEMTDDYVLWFIDDKSVLSVNKNLFPSSQKFIKFPKGFIYNRFSQVLPSIGGYYNY